jgi:hypothetical protein
MMSQRFVAGVTGLALVCTMTGVSPLLAQTPQTAPPPAVQTPPSDPDLPVNVERIKKALGLPPALRLDEEQLRFYVRVVAKMPHFEDFIHSFDLKVGGVPGAGMTHQEFLNMVTPREIYGATGMSAGEMLTIGLVNMAGQMIIKKGLQALREAKTEREIQAVRERINKELAALMGKS